MKRVLISWPEVYEITGIHRSTAWRKEIVGEFPPRIITGFNEVKWDKALVKEWLKDNNKGGFKGKCTKKRNTK